MRRFLCLPVLVIYLLESFSIPTKIASAQSIPATIPEPETGSVVCPPGIYLSTPDDCLPLGPSQVLKEAAAENIPYPILPLPTYSPDASLAELSYLYLKLDPNDEKFYLFPTLEAAMASTTSDRKLGPGMVIVSYKQRVVNDQGVFYQIETGDWIRGTYGARMALHRPFQGLLFSSHPRNSFGWVLDEMPSFTAPSLQAPVTGRTYYRYNVVQIFGDQEEEGITWLRIGTNEWLDGRQVARVIPRSKPPEGIQTQRWIEVNLEEQTLAVYQEDKLIFATLVSTGIDQLWTRPGIFLIFKKKETEIMSGSTEADRSDYYYLENVPWTMYFDEGRALHGAYWHDSFGYQRSHGCVNLSIGDAHWLFEWANEGDTVYVYDPSGRTPVDPSLYGAGAP